jgi:hypothetical protein
MRRAIESSRKRHERARGGASDPHRPATRSRCERRASDTGLWGKSSWQSVPGPVQTSWKEPGTGTPAACPEDRFGAGTFMENELTARTGDVLGQPD